MTDSSHHVVGTPNVASFQAQSAILSRALFATLLLTGKNNAFLQQKKVGSETSDQTSRIRVGNNNASVYCIDADSVDSLLKHQNQRRKEYASETKTVQIPLTQSQHALVDAEDLPKLAPYRWTAIRSRNTWYAKTHVDNRTIYMHRLILFGDEAEDASLKVDHKNRNGLDNRRENLRSVTHSHNLMNSVGRRSIRKSRFKGVSLRNHASKPFRATIHFNGKQKHLGYFASEEDAAKAYDSEAERQFGSHARINFPDDELGGLTFKRDHAGLIFFQLTATFCQALTSNP